MSSLSFWVALPTFSAAFVALWMAWFVRRRLKATEASPSYGFWATVALWSLFGGLETLAPSFESKMLWIKLQYFAICPLPVFWLAFNLRYAAGRQVSLMGRFSLLFVIPVLTIVLVWTSSSHTLIWESMWLNTSGPLPFMEARRGWYFWWVHTAYSYTLLFAGVAVVVSSLLTSSRNYRRQLFVILLAAGVVVALNLLYLQDVGWLRYSDPTPIGFGIGSIILAAGMFRSRLLDMVPVAQAVVFESLPDAVLLLDPDDRLIDINPAARRLFSRRRSEMFGQKASEIMPSFHEYRHRLLSDGGTPFELEISQGDQTSYFRLRGAPLLNERKEVAGRIVIIQDITEHREYRDLAIRDGLTGLSNRWFFELEAKKALALARRIGWSDAAVFIDVNGLKRVNDEMGHLAGDAMIVETARRLESALRNYESLARLGGDEFATILQRVTHDEVREVCERMEENLKVPFVFEGQPVDLSAAIGVAMFPEDADGLKNLMAAADEAMYVSKAEGRGFVFYKAGAGD